MATPDEYAQYDLNSKKRLSAGPVDHTSPIPQLNIREWLTQLGLDMYVQQFEDEAITVNLLHTLSDADLKELGVSKMGHRRLLMEAITALKSAPVSHAFNAYVFFHAKAIHCLPSY